MRLNFDATRQIDQFIDHSEDLIDRLKGCVMSFLEAHLRDRKMKQIPIKTRPSWFEN
jgi:hypothetical protein